MMLVERDTALSLLAGMLEESLRGRGQIALVSGTVSVGKTSLLDVFAGRAADLGATALTAVGSVPESGIPLGVMGQLLHRAPLTGEERARAEQLLATALPGQPLEHTVVHGLCLLLLGLAERQPLALVVDDVHDADPASLECLSYLSRRLRSAHVMAVFSHGDKPAHRHSAFRLDLLRQPNSRGVPLALLGSAGVAELAAERFGPAAAAGFADQCHAVSGGNPLLVRALLDDHAIAVRAGAAPDVLSVGDGFGQAVLSCLHQGGPALLRLGYGLAVLGAPESVDRLLGLESGVVALTLFRLNAAGLLEAGNFRHPVARSAVLMSMEPDERSALHQRAAELAHDDGAPAPVIAEHLVATGAAEADWALPVLEEAAHLALGEGRVGAAIDYLKLACRVCADEPRLAQLRMSLVRAEWRINPGAPTPHLAELTEALHEGHLPGSDAIVLAKALLWHGRYQDAKDVLARLGGSAAAQDPQTAAELRTTRPWMRCSYAPFLELMPELDEGQGVATAPTMKVSHRMDAATVLDTVLSGGLSEPVVEEAERILRSSRLDEMGMDTVESALLALTFAERADRAAPWCDGLIQQAVDRQSPGRQARLSTIRAEISLRQGELPEAARYAQQALEIIPPSSWGVAVGASLASLLTALSAMGRYDEAVDQLNRPVPEAMLQSRYGLHYLRARGRHQLSLGQFDAALGDFQACGKLMGRWGLDVPGLIAWRSDCAETLLLVGEREEARQLAEEQLELCTPSSLRTKGVAMRLLAGTYELRQRPALLRKSVDILRESRDRYEEAQALTDLTRAYHDLGELRRARLSGRRAWELAQECQALPLTRILGAELGQRGGESGADDEAGLSGTELVLSDAERRVAELAVQGYTNREIATRLYVTVSTVEQHLTRAYRKLNVGRRSDLPAALGAR
ncbi:DNA-binding CsgD family transcriptional regulator [Kitasatospora sp. MAP12-15]|uniref:AAA family ATPase n=1 Tax=unclassified Kitasatospora TaxID=2633591 RepID=UPI00247613A0|nr:helix-turn-helix transcriptional regulator [Kitasatospora sp. MAP12-44]MDH6113685.1 DNA-binding CsgD family transcriptional regulator [Kitasatospora sp. MAP12-44]